MKADITSEAGYEKKEGEGVDLTSKTACMRHGNQIRGITRLKENPLPELWVSFLPSRSSVPAIKDRCFGNLGLVASHRSELSRATHHSRGKPQKAF